MEASITGWCNIPVQWPDRTTPLADCVDLLLGINSHGLVPIDRQALRWRGEAVLVACGRAPDSTSASVSGWRLCGFEDQLTSSKARLVCGQLIWLNVCDLLGRGMAPASCYAFTITSIILNLAGALTEWGSPAGIMIS